MATAPSSHSEESSRITTTINQDSQAGEQKEETMLPLTIIRINK
jgi:hypothetical protein